MNMGRLLGVVGGVVGSSVLLVLSLPPALGNALGWICLVPVLVLVHRTRFSIGFLAGLASCLLAARWSEAGWFYPPAQFASAGERLAGDAAWHYMGFLFLGLAVGAVAGVFAELRKYNISVALSLSVFAVSIESGSLLVLPCHLGLSQFRSIAMMHVASVAGLWGVTFLVWASNLAIAAWIVNYREAASSPSLKWAAASFGLVLLIAWVTQTPLPGPEGTASSRQNGSSRMLRLAALQSRSFDSDELVQLSKSTNAWLTVWPELSGTGAALGGDTRRLTSRAQRNNVRFATSYQDGARPKPHNTLSVFSSEGESNRYFKRRLFGGEAAMHVPGERAVVAQVGGIGIGLNICYDSCFPNLIRDTARLASVRFIVLPSMGPESPYGFIQAVHGAFTTFRSAECGVPIVRAELSAYAMITDCDGRILALAPPGNQGAVVAEVPLERRDTVYLRLGDWMLYLCWAGTAAWMLASLGSWARSRGTGALAGSNAGP